MDNKTAAKVNRLRIIEERANARAERAIESGNPRFIKRATDFEMAVHARWASVIGGEVTTYCQ